MPGNLRLAKTRLWRRLFAPMEKRGKKRVHEKTILTTEIRGKTTRKNATHDGNLEVKGGPGGTRGATLAAIICFTGKRVLGMVFA